MRSIAAALLLAALPASALDVAGVAVADTLSLDGKTLLLNGSGIRKKSFLGIKVYVGALYVTQRSTDAAAIVAADAPKALQLTLLRDVDKDSMLKAFREGIEANSPGQAAALAPQLQKVEAAFPAEFKDKQVMLISYAPGKGATIAIQGGNTLTLEGKDFADALFRIWLGPKPTDGGIEDLKAALLAGK